MNTMKQILQLLVVLFAGVQMTSAQAVLPTSFNFDDPTPVGWTESLNSGNARYATGFAGQACRLDGTTDYVLVEFAEEPGDLTYYLKAQNQGGAFVGTFTVEESVDGVTFTPLHAFVDAALPSSAYTQFTDAPASASRFIRFYFTNKVSGNNVALDEVMLVQPTASPEQEINVTDAAANNIPSGYTYSTGSATNTALTIQNLGQANALTISSIDISGPDAAQFSLLNVPTSIDANMSADFDVVFTPIGLGSRFCTLTINNNDVSESAYVINLYAISGTLASEPTAQPTDLWFPGLNAWNYRVNFDDAIPTAEHYIVLRKKGSAVTEIPADGESYLQGEWIGGAQVVYVGAAGEFDARYIETSTAYHLSVFSYNGPEGYENYLTGSPLTGVATTNDPEIGTTYDALDPNSASFIADLEQVMNPANYFQIYYSNYISTLIDEFYVRDTVLNGVSQNFVECQYSGVDYVYPASFQWWNGSSNATLSREHTFPQSWMPTYLNADFPDSYEVSDQHNLIPVEQETCNAVRSNYPYGEVVTVTSTYQGTSFGQNANGQTCYEPREEIKGDAARSMMYHSVKNSVAGDDFSFPETISFTIQYGQQEHVVKQWHFNDLPTNYERARNEYIYNEQHNRNAFVDQVTYPCYIRFANLTPWKPIFTSSNNVLTCIDPCISYQWSLNGVEISGATASTYTITQSGNYSVRAQQFAQCPEFESNQTSVTYIGVDEIENAQFNFEVFPNPSNGAVSVVIHSNSSAKAQLRVIDLTGNVAYNTTINVIPGKNTMPLDVNLSSGIYMVEVHTTGGLLTEKIIVE